MFGSAILEVAIGVVFVYLLVAIICSSVREGVEAFLKTRAAYLERGIRELLHDPHGKNLAKAVYEHPLIYSLYSGTYAPVGKGGGKPGLLARGTGLPSYLPGRNFATALLDIAARGPDPAVASDERAPVLDLATIRANISNLNCEPVQRVMLTAIDAAQGSLERAQRNLEAWYDSGMDRVGGWYKRSTQWILFWVALVVVVGMNINTITIADFLYRDDAARAVVVARAQAVAGDTAFASRGYEAARQELDALALPIGWGSGWGAPRPASLRDPWNGLFGPILGWLLTAFAATLGAPFWFDLLNKMMVIRSTVKPSDKVPDRGSGDGGSGPPPPAASPPATALTSAPPPPPPGPQPVTGSQPAAGAAPAVGTPHPIGAVPAPQADVVPGHGGTGRARLADACDIPITQVTPDEELPPAEGGVA